MNRRSLLMIATVVGVVGVSLFLYSKYGGGPKVKTPTTTLQIEITGGFAYVSPVSPDNHLEVAYLNDWVLRKDTNGNGVMEETEPVEFDDVNKNGQQDAGEPDICNVHQLGTQFKVMQGDIIDHQPSTVGVPGDRVFPLNKTVVKFPALESANIPLTMGGAGWPPPVANPLNEDTESEWADMVPALRQKHSGTAIDPNWRSMVNGRFVLPGGNIKATIPSIQAFKKARFDFKANKVSQFKSAMTDKTIYTVDVPSENIEIQLSGPTGTITKLVIKPQGNKVVLKLWGEHDMGSPIPGDGAPLKDFCTFYQLLQPRPTASSFLVPHYIAPGSGGGGGASGLPSPGFFCPGDWF